MSDSKVNNLTFIMALNYNKHIERSACFHERDDRSDFYPNFNEY